MSRFFGGMVLIFVLTAPLRAGHPLFTNLAPGTALDLGPYTCVDLDVGCARIVEYSTMVYDPDGHRVLMYGGGHATTFRDDVDVLDLKGGPLVWTPAYVPTPCAAMGDAQLRNDGAWTATGHPASRHTYDQLVYAPNVQRLLVLSGVAGAGGCSGLDVKQWLGGKMHHYDPAAVQWTPSLSNVFPFGLAGEYDPLSGRVVALGSGGFWTYDPTTQSSVQWPVGVPSDIDYAANLVYFPLNQRMYFIERTDPTRVLEVSLDRSDWSQSTVAALSPASPAPASEETGWATDTANGLIGGGVRDGVFYTFDPVARLWSQRTMVVESSTAGISIGSVGSSVEGDSGRATHSHALVYVPSENVYIFLANGSHGLRTWAYRHAGGAPVSSGPAPRAPRGFRRR